jgi:DNA-binding response OmpR family regulator
MTVNPSDHTVLIVDDEVQLRRVLERVVSRWGYQVQLSASAEGAYEMIAAQRPDAILLDVRLPTMSGLSLYLAVVARWPEMTGRIAVMSGDADEDVTTWASRNGCALLRKPFDLAEVEAWLAWVLRRRGRQAENA